MLYNPTNKSEIEERKYKHILTKYDRKTNVNYNSHFMLSYLVFTFLYYPFCIPPEMQYCFFYSLFSPAAILSNINNPNQRGNQCENPVIAKYIYPNYTI